MMTEIPSTVDAEIIFQEIGGGVNDRKSYVVFC